ncbi:MAG: hypothetical protein QM500_12215 [Methylococcales bacterium]
MYKNESDKIADVLMANSSPIVRWVPTNKGKLALKTLSNYERQIAHEEIASSVTRLAIDKAMSNNL